MIKRIECTWNCYKNKNNQLNGKYTHFWIDGSIRINGQYFNGRCVGIWKDYFDNTAIDSIYTRTGKSWGYGIHIEFNYEK